MIRRFVRPLIWSLVRLAPSAALACAAVPLAAQSSGQSSAQGQGQAGARPAATGNNGAELVPSTAIPVVQSTAISPSRTLNTALARLARDPRDMAALVDAGGAALDLGDTDAAIGFLTRAEQVAPGSGGVRARIGVAMLRAGQPFEAIHWFDLADETGFPRAEMATERGLAYDLIGDNTAAQRHYQLALAAGPNDEASRRYSISLVIAGDRRGAELVLQPLLERQDRGAWRVRTFIMAIAGQSDEAEGIARATMPADLATAIAPYLRYMPRLTPAQQAAAANLGRFPRAADIGRDDPQVVQYALAHPRAPRVDAGLVPQGEALGARGRDDRDSRAKRRRPGKDSGRETAVAVAAPPPAPLTPPPPPPPAPTPPAVTAPWGLPAGTRTAAAPAQPQIQPQAQQQLPAPQSAAPPAAAKPVVLSKLDVPPGTPIGPPLAPRPAASAPLAAAPAPQVAPSPAPQVTAPPPVSAPPPVIAPPPAPIPAAPTTAPRTQLALAAPPPAPAAALSPPPAQQAAPQPAPAPAAPADFRRTFDGYKPPEQEGAATTEAVDLARVESLRQAAKGASAKTKDRAAKDRAAKDRGERPDGPTAVSRISGEDVAEPMVTRAGKDKASKDAAAKAAKDKLALDCQDKPGKGKAAAKGKAATGKAAKGKTAKDSQCPPENAKAQKGKGGKAEPAHASRIWVQVLTGSNREAMGKEWQNLVREAAALRGRRPYITPWRSNFRLLTGPFASDAEAQAFLGQLRKDGVSGFQWTSPAGQAVDGMAVK
ncbi:MAG: SPOR domain-containing protein [Novosphingobium sp.]|uniref:SPOR domain-containing protein n=1 Tax=Novosphingobium sp. TaxID=1874826 RepID=UPI0030185DD0